VASEIQRVYAEVVRGMRPEYMDWLTPVYGPVKARLNGHNGHKVASNGHKNGHGAKSAVNGATRPRKGRQPATKA
jgi:hypothetical protein